MFREVYYTKLKRNEKYLCDDGFNTYIGIFKRYQNRHALFENTHDITILDTIIKANNMADIKYNRFSKYYNLSKYAALLLSIPSFGLVNYYLGCLSDVSYLWYSGLIVYELMRGRRFTSIQLNSDYIGKLIITLGGPCINMINRPGIYKEFIINCFVYGYIRYTFVIEYAPRGSSFYEMNKTKQKIMEQRMFNKVMYRILGHETLGTYL